VVMVVLHLAVVIWALFRARPSRCVTEAEHAEGGGGGGGGGAGLSSEEVSELPCNEFKEDWRRKLAAASARCVWRRSARAPGAGCCRGAGTGSTRSASTRGCARAAGAPSAALRRSSGARTRRPRRRSDRYSKWKVAAMFPPRFLPVLHILSESM
jgi:hypothetical protein